MHFVLLKFVLLLFTVTNRSLAWKIRVDRHVSGVDHFQLLDEDKKSICTTSEKATEFCAKHSAVIVKNTKICPGDQETLHCRCNSTKSTFLLHEERCVDVKNVPRYLRTGTFPDCKSPLVVQDGSNRRSCDSAQVPTLLTSYSDSMSYSICTEVLQKVVSCKVTTSKSMYFNNGRWKRMLGLDSRGKTVGAIGNDLETILQKLSSNNSRWSGFIVSLQVTCIIKPEFSFRLRGHPPPEQAQSCLLLKISGSHVWSLKPYQINFTQPHEVTLNLTRNQTNHREVQFNLTRNQTSYRADDNKTVSGKEVTKSTSTTTLRYQTTATYSKLEDSGVWTVILLGIFYGFLFVLIVVVALFMVRYEYCRRLGTERNKIPPRRSIGNPTYERGRDNSLTLTPMTAVNHSDPSPYAVFSCASVYQPIVENTRPHSVNGCNLYESLKSIKENSRRRAVTYSLYQDLNANKPKTQNVNRTYEEMGLPLETPAENPSSLTSNDSNCAAAAISNSNEQCESESTPQKSKPKQRSKSEVFERKKLSLVKRSAAYSLPVAKGENAASFDSNKQCDLKSVRPRQIPESSTEASDCEKCPSDELREEELTVVCHSSPSSSLQEKETAHHHSLDIADTCAGVSSESDAIRDSLRDDTSDCRLSCLEIVIDSDYSECDETENQSDEYGQMENQSDKSDRFYYVLEGPNPT